jgi:putative ABC transport system ATP-binding protein
MTHDPPPAADRGPPALRLVAVRKVHRSGDSTVTALDDLDFVVRRGEWTAIMGPSGSGKSSLLNVLGCLDTPDSGLYELDGIDVGTLDDDARADVRNQKLGFVFQGFNLLPGASALDNVVLPMLYDRAGRFPDAEARAREALRRVGLGHRLDHAPNALSGGQQQRVAIARALVTEPLLLLADEPTGNLDSQATDDILALFAELHAQGVTIVMVTHEPDVAARCSRTVVLRDGRIVSDTAARPAVTEPG